MMQGYLLILHAFYVTATRG